MKVTAKATKKKIGVEQNGVSVEMWTILDVNIGRLKDLFNKVLMEGKMIED